MYFCDRTGLTYEALSPSGEVIAPRDLPTELSRKALCGAATRKGTIILRRTAFGGMYEFDPATAEYSKLPNLPSGWSGYSIATVPSTTGEGGEEYVVSTTKGVAKLDPVAG